jgi:hypothetical protein
MSKISKYVKLDKNILLEYIYDSENNISEAYDILVDSKEKKRSYLATDTSGTNNIKGNQLFRLDNLSNRFGKIDTSYYTFLQIKNYATSNPIRHDSIRIHLPVNWTFGEYLGFHCRVYGYDTLMQKTFDLSNFYFDMSDVSQSYLLNYTSPPLFFQEKLWGKNITIEIPAHSAISAQRENNLPKENSINYNLTAGLGLSLTSPIFIEFSFINSAQTINGITTYLLAPKVSTTVSQNPEFEDLGLKIQHSSNGDFFEIFGTYNGTLGGFKQFIDDSFILGNRYYVQYNITMYEQNIRGKSITAVVTENFNENIEFRPIIKFSTTTAIIDVEMRLIDAVDDTYIIRRASYGMLQDEVARYSLNLIKINLKNANKPKIYNIKNSIDPSLVGLSNSMGSIKLKKRLPVPPTQIAPASAATILQNPEVTSVNTGGLISNAPSNISTNPVGSTSLSSAGNTPTVGSSTPSPTIETVKVPYPVLYDRFNIISKSENVKIGSDTFFGTGKMQIIINPFDNVVKFTIAKGEATSPQFYDLSGFTELKLVFKNDTLESSFPLFTQSNDVNLSQGQVVFKIPQNKVGEIKKIYNSNVNVFYIIGVSSGNSSMIYSGLFKPFDSPDNINDLNKNNLLAAIKEINKNIAKPEVKIDPVVASSIAQAQLAASTPDNTTTTPTAAPAVDTNISQEVTPQPKPSGIKDMISKGINPKPKEINKPKISIPPKKK